MRVISDQTFDGGRHELDGVRFERCRFIGAMLVYWGEGAAQFVNCSFQDCKWSLEGPSARTLDLLADLFHHAGQEGRDLVEATFAGIREGTIGAQAPFPAQAEAVPA